MDNRIKDILARLNKDAASSEEADALEKDFKKIWDHSRQYKQQSTPNFATEKNLAQLKSRIHNAQKIQPAPTKIRRLILPKIAAAVVFLLVSIWLINQQLNTSDEWQWAENTGTENVEILLQDGSVVQLYPGSKLGHLKSYNKQSERAVSLNGTAHFDVQHDPAKPFLIETNATQIRVLGTQFVLSESAEQKETTVSVEEGSVAFTDKSTGKMVEVGARETGVCQAGGILFQESSIAPKGPEIIQLRRATLARLAAQLSRRQNWTIDLNNGIQTCTISGTFDLSQPKGVFA